MSGSVAVATPKQDDSKPGVAEGIGDGFCKERNTPSVTNREGALPSTNKTHTRSASHVGILRSGEALSHKDHHSSFYSSGGGSHNAGSIPSCVKGHQRAFSQGQVNDGRGHKRDGSKTDFILPEGHERREREREMRAPKSSFKGTSLQRRGHSREASRTESVYTIRDQKRSHFQRLFFWKKVTPESSTRLVVPNHVVSSDVSSADHPNSVYPGNRISTTKYTLFTFLPKNLFEQFHRFANLYFLFIVLLNFVPSVNAFAKELAILPLAFVLGVTALKDWFEDLRRRRSDSRVNARTCRVYSSLQGRYVKVMWADVRVGDIVHLSCDETVPADLVLLNSSDDQGVCYIESSDLDGETNLKQRQCVRGIGMDSEFEVSKFDSVLEVGPPTTKIYHFVGSIPIGGGAPRVSGSGTVGRGRVPLSKDNILLRDCVVKNTDFVEGIVVYAGRETKSLLNNGGTRYKRSKLERQMNQEVVWCVIILILISLFSATGSALWQNAHMESYLIWMPYIIPISVTENLGRTSHITQSPIWVAFTTFWTFIILYQVLIPISLYVTVEIIKLMQIYHIHNDPHFKNKANKTNINCRALNITEELGQVDYVFTDKTGTLTENNMVFQRCSINGVDYGHAPLIVNSKQNDVRDSFIVNQQLQEELSSLELQYIYVPPSARPCGSSVAAANIKSHQDSQRILDFFFTLASCNTVIVAKRPRKDQMNASGVIEAASSAASEETTPRQYLPSKNLFRSLFPSSSFTPESSPKMKTLHNHHPLPLSNIPPLSPLKVAPHITEISLHTFEPVPEHGAALGCSQNPRPNVLQLGPKYHSTQTSRSPSPGMPLDTLKPIYEAESPDELALVDAAYKYGCRLLRRNLHSVLVALPGMGIKEYEVLNVLPFDSDRKRMSVIIRHPETNEKILYCKGADSAILENLSRRSDEDTQLRIMQTQQHLNSYSKQGLRVLCMAKKVISEAEYEEWLRGHRQAETTLANREKKLSDSYNKIEMNMQLLGATGIEDRLQDGVPETVKALREAGIVVWVLTGDKQETAINIAYSCSLFSSNMEVLKLNARTKEQTERTIGVYLQQIEEQEEGANQIPPYSSSSSRQGNSVPRGGVSSARNSLDRSRMRERGLVVDGRTLVYILDRRTNLKAAFLRLAKHCQAVMCCRATPLQKALIVRIAKDKLKVLTLAVGDGANDVSMIQTADVGVGISGVEGRQAVMSSDFAITRFRHLEKLLLVHGHWCYERLARMILYFFYKNACFVFLLMWFQLYCGYSTAVMMDDLYLVMFNLLFTSLPPICVGIYDQDAPEDLLLSKPALYSKTRLGTVYTSKSFWINIVDALYQSVVLFFVGVAVYDNSEAGIYEFGMTITHACVITQLLHIAIETKSWTVLHVATLALSYLVYYLFGFLYTVLCNGCIGLPSQYGELEHMILTPKHWFCVLLSCTGALLPRFVIRALQTTFCPDEVTLALRERKAINKGQFVEKISRASSMSSVFRTSNEEPSCHAEEDVSDAMSSLVTMTTFVSANEDTEA